MNILVTGCAGFIGSNLVDQLLLEGFQVVGVDNFNNYYDPRIKRENVAKALASRKFKCYEVNILDFPRLTNIFKNEGIDKVIHLAARAGVRPSIEDPFLYSEVNVLGTVNLLKLSTEYKVRQFIFGSSSSVYGESKKLPFGEDDNCQEVASPYGASKRAAEFFVESFHHSFGLPSVILRFFTVYGERGRPDMAPALFTSAIVEGKKIVQFGDGSTSRDYTYVGDIVRGIILTLNHDFEFEVINLGNSSPVKLSDFISILENTFGKVAKIETRTKQSGDVDKTWANIARANRLLGWQPQVDLAHGIRRYFEWLQKSK